LLSLNQFNKFGTTVPGLMQSFIRRSRKHNSISFGLQVIVASGAALSILVAIGVLSYRRTLQEDEDQEWVTHTHLVLEKLHAILSDLVNEETGMRGYVITGDESYLQPYISSAQRLQHDIGEVRTLTFDNAAQQRSLSHVEPLLTARVAQLEQGIAARRGQGLAAAVSAIKTGGGLQTMDQIRDLINEMQREEGRLLGQRLQLASMSSRRAKVLIIAGNVVALMFLLAAALVVHREMSGRQKTEEYLRQSEERFRMLVSGVKDYAIVMLDPKGTIVSWNDGAERIKGYPSEEILGSHFSRFYPTIDMEDGKPERLLMEAVEQGRIEDEGWRIRKDGSRFWADVVITALYDEKKRLRGFAKVTRDMTERRQAEEEIKYRNAQLQNANDELKAFSYSVSHDLRAPLRAIDGFSQALFEDYNDELDLQGRSYIQRIRAGVGKMGQLIDGMLDLARISRAEMIQDTVDLSSLAREIAADLTASHPERRVSFTIPAALPVKGDRLLLRVVLENLLRNAWKFTSERDRASIEIGVQTDGDQTIHFIRDDGAGFDMQYAGKLFGVFQRLHRETEFPGTGIGLATVQRIIHRHGGRIWAEASRGHGATFYFALEE
jgi:PAS domain S-box-containing protein